MATAYQSTEITNGAPSRLVSIGLTPKYKELDPATLAVSDTFEVFLVPGGVRVVDGFVTAVGGTGLDVHATPTLTLKLEITDDDGTRTLIASTSAVRATATFADLSVKGLLINSENNDALVKLTLTAAAATAGTSNIGVYLEWSAYADDTIG